VVTQRRRGSAIGTVVLSCIKVGHQVALGNSGVIKTMSVTPSYITFCSMRWRSAVGGYAYDVFFHHQW
jgi:hypothetical protein